MAKKKINFRTPEGILDEIENAINDFKENLERANEVELRLRGCNHAIKIHTLTFMRERFEEIEKPRAISHLR